MKKTVLIVSEYFPPEIPGGAAASVYSLASSLESQGERVIVLTAKANKSIEEGRFEIYEAEFREYYHYQNKGFPLLVSKILSHVHNVRSFSKKIREIVKEQDIDIIHTQSTDTTLAAAILRKRMDIPIVSTIRGHWVECFWIEKMLPSKSICSGCRLVNQVKCLRNRKSIFSPRCVFNLCLLRIFMSWQHQKLKYIDLFLPISNHLERELGERGYSTRLIPNIFDPVNFNFNKKVSEELKNILNKIKKAKSDKNKKVALYIGRIRENKGIGLIIKNANDFKDYIFVICGDKDHKYFFDQLQKYIKENNVDNILFPGWIPYRNVNLLYEMSDLILLPFLREEPLSRSMLEALHWGKAILATRLGGNADGVINGENGILCSPDEEGFKAGMKEISKMDLEMLGKKSKEIFNEEFCPTKIIEKYIEEYEQILFSKKVINE